MRNIYIVNKNAGRKEKTEEIEKLIKEVDPDAKIILTESIESAQREVTRLSYTAIPTTIYFVGGDGGLIPIIEAKNPKVPLGIIPGGTGNDFIKTVYGDVTVDKAFLESLILSEETKLVDTIKIETDLGNTLALNIGSVGLSGMAVLEAEKLRNTNLKPSQKYYLGILRAFLNYKSPFTDTEILLRDGTVEKRKGKLLIGAFCNGKCFGGGLNISPGSIEDDDKFEFVMVDNTMRLLWPSLLGKLKAGTHRTSNKVSFYEDVESVTITSNDPIIGEHDGEPYKSKRIKFGIGPRTLIKVPKKSN